MDRMHGFEVLLEGLPALGLSGVDVFKCFHDLILFFKFAVAIGRRKLIDTGFLN